MGSYISTLFNPSARGGCLPWLYNTIAVAYRLATGFRFCPNSLWRLVPY